MNKQRRLIYLQTARLWDAAIVKCDGNSYWMEMLFCEEAQAYPNFYLWPVGGSNTPLPIHLVWKHIIASPSLSWDLYLPTIMVKPMDIRTTVVAHDLRISPDPTTDEAFLSDPGLCSQQYNSETCLRDPSWNMLSTKRWKSFKAHNINSWWEYLNSKKGGP